MQPRHRATTMRSAETELQNTIELRAAVSEIAPPKPDGSRLQSRKKTTLKRFLKGFLKGKLLLWKLREFADKSLSQPGCSHSNTIYDLQLQKTTVLRRQSDVSLCNVKSHTTLHQGQSFCYVLLCNVKSHTTLQGQVSVAHHPSSFQVSEFYLSVTRKYCFPTSFDNMYLWYVYIMCI